MARNTLARRALALLAGFGLVLVAGWREADVDRVPVRAGTEFGKALFAPEARDSFSVVVFGDRTGGPRDGVKLLREGVRMANRLDPDFSMTVGDMVQGYNMPHEWVPQMEEYVGIMRGLERPWYPVAGNHDVYARRGIEGGHVELYKQHFGPLYYSFDYAFAHFVVLYSDEQLSFSNPRRDQNLSAEQMAWLSEDLAASEAEQVFVFLHHPRWLYEGCNWPAVHEVLAADGRVRAVFAGHLHTWRDDGVKDGIHYYAVASTGAHIGSYRESAQIHEVAHVRFRRDGFSVGVIPVGQLHGGDMVLGSEVDAMNRLRRGDWLRTRGRAMVSLEGPRDTGFRVEFENPSDRELRYTARFHAPEGWELTSAESSFRLAPGESRAFPVVAKAPPFDGGLPAVRIELEADFPLESGLVQPIRTFRDVPIGIVEAAQVAHSRPDEDRVLRLASGSCLRVPMTGEFDALTIECWANAPRPPSWMGLVAKTQSSGFSITWSEVSPTGSIRIEGRRSYVTVQDESFDRWNEWIHVALVWDGETARLYVDGELADEEPAKGRLNGNQLPLFVGADTNRDGKPEAPFVGFVDEVRVSNVARYTDGFAPARRFEPDDHTVLLLHLDADLAGVHPDASGNHHHGWPIRTPELVERGR